MFYDAIRGAPRKVMFIVQCSKGKYEEITKAIVATTKLRWSIILLKIKKHKFHFFEMNLKFIKSFFIWKRRGKS